MSIARFGRVPVARHVLLLLVVGTVPATIGLLLERQLELFQESVTAVAVALLATGLVLVVSGFIVERSRTLEQATATDAVLVGIAQATALLPGISRSGMTITAALGRGLTGAQAARFSFLLAVPAIAGGGLIETVQLAGEGAIPLELWVGVVGAGPERLGEVHVDQRG